MISNKLLARAEELLGTRCKPFTEVDPFNKGNTVEGLIGIHSDHRYGSLFITSINGFDEEQLIFATPKLHYPFDKVGRYDFPSAQTIETYTKLDGTNIFMFRYTAQGRTYTSYKTRLRPFLASLGRFGDFLDMWKEMLLNYPDIPKLFLTNPQMDGFSFELYGSLNRHLMKYSVALDTALLFAIKGDAEVIPPSWLNLESLALPVVTLESKITGNYVWEYEQSQETMNAALKDTDVGLEGQEGTVWYLLTKDGAWLQLKCLDGRSRILTKFGWRTLWSIITHTNEDVEVLSLNEATRLYEWKKVIARYRTPIDKQKLIRVGLKHSPNVARNFAGINVTEDHPFLTSDGWKPAKDLREEDKILTGEPAPNNLQMEIFDGTMLGDSCIPNTTRDTRVRFEHIDIEYARLKEAVFSSLGAKGHAMDRTKYNPNSHKSWIVAIPSAIWISQQRERWYTPDGKFVPKDLELTPLLAAVWYMDDGHLQVKGTSCHIILATNGFSKEDVEFLSVKLAAWEIENVITTQNTICLNTKAAKRFLERISPFVPPEMNRKILTPQFQPELWDVGETVLGYDSPVFGPASTPSSDRTVFCIDVEDNHNFVTKGGVVHNCKPEQIENIHWAAGGIPKLMLKATAYNVLESEPELTKEALVSLLLEEFTQEHIDASIIRIEGVLEEVKVELEFQDRVARALEKLIPPGSLIDYELTLPDVMRFLSKHFERGEMSAVYHHATVLLEKEFGSQFFTRDRMCGGE